MTLAIPRLIGICIQGFRNPGDITKFHTVISHKRYKPLHSPLKLCYDTGELVKIGSVDFSASQLAKRMPWKQDSRILSL
jgi:hypothetical protein